jgi:hypothetical protein
MSEHGAAAEVETATGNDYAEHNKTYKFFVGLTKWGTISVVVIIILMAYFLT